MPAQVLARLRAACAAAAYHGVDLEPADWRGEQSAEALNPDAIAKWLKASGLACQAMRLKWRHVVTHHNAPPMVLMFKDGSAGLLVGADTGRNVVWMKDPLRSMDEPPIAVDELRLLQVWDGAVVAVRRARNAGSDAQPFDMRWLRQTVLREKVGLREIGIASVALSIVTILPAFLIMQVINRVLQYRSISSLVAIALIVLLLVIYETGLTWARQSITNIVGLRIDTRIQLHIFARMLSLPVEYFERTQAGLTIGRLVGVNKIRQFITDKLMKLFVDSFTLVLIVPFLLYLNAFLTWIILLVGGVIGLIILLFLKPLSRLVGEAIGRGYMKSILLYETVSGVRTVKTLSLEPARKAEWDVLVANSGEADLRVLRMSNLLETTVLPLERLMTTGVILMGAYIALRDPSSMNAGSLIAFMMLSGRVAAPLLSFARLLQDMNQMSGSLVEAGAVLNQPTETKALTTGMRPPIKGALTFEDVNFSYPGSDRLALDRVNFSIPAGTMLGVVGRSGSGKSTVTRLLQGVSRGYTGFVRLDGVDMREINLAHLRRSLGVVLQDNFLFRGTVRDNITAGRPGLTIEDVIRAARLAGAEEFIERMPAGYETWIEEGSTNISGGQRQRLAIARAVISDPKLMILDEATSALDPESEALVNANLQRIAKGRTMVIVSHRLSSLVDCDQILVMDAGKVIDVGPHAILVERCAIYRTLWLQQNRHLDPQRGGEKPAPALAQGDD